jgi:putative PEP-CTERM system histidine kinase
LAGAVLTVALFSYLSAVISYLVVTLLLLTSWRGRPEGQLLVTASAITAIWALALLLQESLHIVPSALIWSLDVIKTTSWLYFVWKILSYAFIENKASSFFFKYAQQLIFMLSGLLLLLVWVFTLDSEWVVDLFNPQWQIFGHVLLALFGLGLIEQLYRNTRPEQRWAIKFLCLAIGGLFAYDFFLYSDALLFKRIDSSLWEARGFFSAMLVPLIMVSAARNPEWSLNVFISRGVVFHSATLVAAGVYLLIMATAGYYIRLYGGEWGAVAQMAFLGGAIVVLIVLLFSGQIRSRIRVFLSKHFFSYTYDYRDEWIRIIATLSGETSDLPLPERTILTISQLVESPSGLLWLRDKRGGFQKRAEYGEPDISIREISGESSLVRFLENKGWVVNLDECQTLPELYEGFTPPDWINEYENCWLFVPLFKGEQLFGIILLTNPRTPINWNWEVIDLLKTASQQAASYLVLDETARKLAEARQFEGFNRLSAFVIHDLKNLIAQLTLVVRNAEKHSGNPEFLKDAIGTVDHAVGKMNRLMAQLKNAGSAENHQSIELGALLKSVVASRSVQMPIPIIEKVEMVSVSANKDRLFAAIEHIIQNGQDAATVKGTVKVRLQIEQNRAIVEVEDNGCGMDELFIRNRLFKPFETTKGLTGMGIGAYESKEYLQSLGGGVKVTSTVGEGSIFHIELLLEESSEKGGSRDDGVLI